MGPLLNNGVKAVTKAAGILAENLGVDINSIEFADKGLIFESPHHSDFSLGDVQKFFINSVDLFVNYAYCGDEHFCKDLYDAIYPTGQLPEDFEPTSATRRSG